MSMYTEKLTHILADFKIDNDALKKELIDTFESDWVKKLQNEREDRKFLELINKQDHFISLLCRIIGNTMSKKRKRLIKEIENDLSMLRNKLWKK